MSDAPKVNESTASTTNSASIFDSAAMSAFLQDVSNKFKAMSEQLDQLEANNHTIMEHTDTLGQNAIELCKKFGVIVTSPAEDLHDDFEIFFANVDSELEDLAEVLDQSTSFTNSFKEINKGMANELKKFDPECPDLHKEMEMFKDLMDLVMRECQESVDELTNLTDLAIVKFNEKNLIGESNALMGQAHALGECGSEESEELEEMIKTFQMQLFSYLPEDEL